MIVKLRMRPGNTLSVLEINSVYYIDSREEMIFGTTTGRVTLKGVSPSEYQCYLEELYEFGSLDLKDTALRWNWADFSESAQ